LTIFLFFGLTAFQVVNATHASPLPDPAQLREELPQARFLSGFLLRQVNRSSIWKAARFVRWQGGAQAPGI
jgi:hypothetical protein